MIGIGEWDLQTLINLGIISVIILIIWFACYELDRRS